MRCPKCKYRIRSKNHGCIDPPRKCGPKPPKKTKIYHKQTTACSCAGIGACSRCESYRVLPRLAGRYDD